MPDASQDGVCRMTASVVSLAGTATGHLMCDRPASHIDKTPGQVAYEAWVRSLTTSTPDSEPAWEQLEGRQQGWEAIGAAVLAAQHYDETDRISWMHGKVPGNGQPG